LESICSTGRLYTGQPFTQEMKCVMDEILGEFGGEAEDRGKNSISERLTAIQNNAEKVQELEDEVDELKERLDRERRRNNDLATTNVELLEDRRNTVEEDNFEKLANYLTRAIGCSRGRPVETRIGAVKDHLVKLDSMVKEDLRAKNLQAEIKRKSERLRKLDNE